MSQTKNEKKLQYLKATGTSDEVVNYLRKNDEHIGHKLVVWLGRALQFKLNLLHENAKQKQDSKSSTLSMDDTNIFLGIRVLDHDHKLFDVRTMDGKLADELSDEERQVAPIKTVTMMEAIRYIEDWFVSVSPNISNFTIESAYEESRKWHIALANNQEINGYKLKEDNHDKDVVFRHGKYKIVNVTTKHDLVVEGNFMGHCVGTAGYSSRLSDTYKILSVRDETNEPHATIELDGKNLKQIKGKQNKVPVTKYIPIIVLWIIDNNLKVADCHDFLSFPDELTIDGEEYELVKYEIVEENLEG